MVLKSGLPAVPHGIDELENAYVPPSLDPTYNQILDLHKCNEYAFQDKIFLCPNKEMEFMPFVMELDKDLQNKDVATCFDSRVYSRAKLSHELFAPLLPHVAKAVEKHNSSSSGKCKRPKFPPPPPPRTCSTTKNLCIKPPPIGGPPPPPPPPLPSTPMGFFQAATGSSENPDFARQLQNRAANLNNTRKDGLKKKIIVQGGYSPSADVLQEDVERRMSKQIDWSTFVGEKRGADEGFKSMTLPNRKLRIPAPIAKKDVVVEKPFQNIFEDFHKNAKEKRERAMLRSGGIVKCSEGEKEQDPTASTQTLQKSDGDGKIEENAKKD